ncbi:M15 family metallopeptidase [Siphonobacter sp. SORGH_AS_0500]|uniref:M15 family metallopeptidase n=1 Tax=Siphonobacter sp. SORGH_AS_0500 TaxID=1864824 RepID=UPI000CC90C91|nr:M15 family metallopeptidase [Siphonobacter sp. SORGH_AS_0500]MDR6196502.1 D-alanyl-D-alanine dipeptidase [Siphonobacter sp. SORGH_AS_0500]PKK37885.1 peptidase M15 [Siphonobacter sp. SORGH_AS_0500]
MKFLLFSLTLLLTNPAKLTTAPCPDEANLEKAGLVDIQKVDPSLLVDLKYSTTDNFVKKDVYGCITRCYLQPDVAQKLKKAQEHLRKNHPNYRLLVYDGVRSRKVQWKLWEALPQYAPKYRTNYVAHPTRGSIHNYGCAVDLTVATADGKALDMGTPFDFFGNEAYPRKEDEMLRQGKITKEHVKNRQILRDAMQAGGFMGITSEWWHFNAMSLAQAKLKYTIVEE